MDSEIWISYNFNMSQNIIIFPQLFKNVKTVLIRGSFKKGNGPDLAHCLLFAYPCSK